MKYPNAPCKGEDPFDVDTMLSLCDGCLYATACRQDAADAPFTAHGVWGGLVLPAQHRDLPPPTTQRTYPAERRPVGRPPWWSDIGRNYQPRARPHQSSLLDHVPHL